MFFCVYLATRDMNSYEEGQRLKEILPRLHVLYRQTLAGFLLGICQMMLCDMRRLQECERCVFVGAAPVLAPRTLAILGVKVSGAEAPPVSVAAAFHLSKRAPLIQRRAILSPTANRLML